MKILSAAQMQALDQYTIDHEPISSIDLMERASRQVVNWITQKLPLSSRFVVFCGPGNNGGDGLSIARQLAVKSFHVRVYYLRSDKYSQDFEVNMERLKSTEITFEALDEMAELPKVKSGALIIDALFGTGLSRPLEGFAAKVVNHINDLPSKVLSVDLPSGLIADAESDLNAIIKASYTLTFEFPKLAFFLPEVGHFAGKWEVMDIGLHQEYAAQLPSQLDYIDADLVGRLKRKRPEFGHKGTFGHALLIAGSKGKAGAAVLAAHSCMRSGVGLLTCHVPSSIAAIIHQYLPEAMVSYDNDDECWTSTPETAYSAIGLGPGLGTSEVTRLAFARFAEKVDTPLVIDADALNMLAQDSGFLELVPHNSILTPHPKEFERLFGASKNDFERLELLKAKAQELGVIIVLKGAYSLVATSEGNVYVNSTGNSGMGTAGSGDVLTGLLTGLRAQGYSSEEAAVLGVFIHGFAGDLAAADLSEEAMIASDIINYYGACFKELFKKG